MPLSWNDEFLVGHQEIDAQHRAIFDYTVSLLKADSHEMRVLVAKGLSDHTRFHFAYEEMLMDGVGYPKAGRQKAQHAALLKRQAEITQAVADRSLLTPKLHEFIKDWLLSHIDNEDTDLAEYLAGHSPFGPEVYRVIEG